MTVTPLGPAGEPDAPLARGPLDPTAAGAGEGAAFAQFLDAAGTAFERAQRAERAFAAGRGGLQEMVFARAEADVLLALASSAATRAAQALGTILGMQV